MEQQFHRWLASRPSRGPWLEMGIGDDASVHRLPSGAATVVTCDLICDQVHFRLEETEPQRVGRKALAVNLSDLAAMGADPAAAWCSLLLPQGNALELAERIYAGIEALAEQFGVAIAGGDCNTWAGRLVIGVTAMGVCRGPAWLRSGAKPGDLILVTGSLGGSILGKHLDFVPRVAEAQRLRDDYTIHAAIDISDGLALDLARMAERSGCGAQLVLDQVPIADAARTLATQSGRSALDHALADGEDFELLLAVPPAEAHRLLGDQPLGVPIVQVGQFVTERGLWQVGDQGRISRLEPRGYEHEG